MASPVISSVTTGGSGGSGGGLSRLDLAKMAVEDLSKRLRKSLMEHNAAASSSTAAGLSLKHLGQGVQTQPDQLLLLSTSRQYPETAACAAGGRLLVGFGGGGSAGSFLGVENTDDPNQPANSADTNTNLQQQQYLSQHDQQVQFESFQRELKSLQAASWNEQSGEPFPESAGGAVGLNAALSKGLQLLSRYRLSSRSTENFGMGRYPTTNMSLAAAAATSAATGAALPSAANQAALQPACLVLVTDGACLRKSPQHGGGELKVQFGNAPLREFYKEPFRWDQRIFCLAVGGGGSGGGADYASSYLHPQIRSLVEMTGGSYWMVRQSNALPTDALLRRMRPLLPKELPLPPDPLWARLLPPIQYTGGDSGGGGGDSSNNSGENQSMPHVPLSGNTATAVTVGGASSGRATCSMPVGASFVNAGPICCFVPFEGEEDGRTPQQQQPRRAMLLYTGSAATNYTLTSANTTSTPDATQQQVLSPPLWCIPEAYFPSKKLDTLPPRQAQPVLHFSKYPQNLGSKTFEPAQLIKWLYRLDELTLANRSNNTTKASAASTARCLHRDVYICEWLSPEGGKQQERVTLCPRQEYFPVWVAGAGRPTLSEDGDSFLNIGILHSPIKSATLAMHAGPGRLTTLTLLPPEPHILLPLLIRAAEQEHRALKRAEEVAAAAASSAGVLKGGGPPKVNTVLDEHWRNEFRAYLFRLPPYYQFALKRTLRTVLPSSAHTLLHTEGVESMALQCFSKVCLQKIRNGEQIARDTVERMDMQEASLRRQNLLSDGSLQARANDEKSLKLRYGQYDPRSSIDSYLSCLRSMPPPWRRAGANAAKLQEESKAADLKSETASMTSEKDSEASKTAIDMLGDLPAKCLMAYYETRRRWIFGGPSLSCRGLHVEGVSNDGSNSHRCGKRSSDREECPLSMAGVGVSVLNETSTTRMGDYRERLLYSRSPVVGYGSNDAAGVAATTGVDGAPVWSVDDDAMPLTFFDPKTGDFADSVNARVRSRLLVNFGNPYKEKRADSMIPENYLSQAPSMQQGGIGSLVGSPRTPPGSPPHDSFDSVEEGEAMFVRTSPSRSSPKRDEPDEDDTDMSDPNPPNKRQRSGSFEEKTGRSETPQLPTSVPPPPKPPSMPSSPSSATASTKPAPPRPAPPSKGISKAAPPPPPPPPRSRPPPPKPIGVRPSGGPVPPTKTAQSSSKSMQKSTVVLAATSAPNSKTPSVSGSSKLPTRVPSKASQLGTVTLAAATGTVTATPASSTDTTATATAATGNTPSEQDLQSPEKKPDVDLPAGWMCVWSKSQKRWYFFDTKSNKSVWKWPP